jgi:hypothetical protein
MIVIKKGNQSQKKQPQGLSLLWALRACHVLQHVGYVSRVQHYRPVGEGDPSILPILQSTWSDQDPEDPETQTRPSLCIRS